MCLPLLLGKQQHKKLYFEEAILKPHTSWLYCTVLSNDAPRWQHMLEISRDTIPLSRYGFLSVGQVPPFGQTWK